MSPETLFSLDGRIVPPSEAVVPVTDRGFLYGDAVFETIHAYGVHPFQLGAHLARLAQGLAALHFDPQVIPRGLKTWVQAAVRAAAFPEANVRLTVTRGTGLRGPAIRGPCRPRTVIMVTRHKRRPEAHYTKGVTAILAGFRRQESSVVAKLKTTAYIEQVLARREADAAGVDEALLLNNAGLLCEGSASNIALVRGGVLRVPEPTLCGALPGTTQALLIRLARGLKIPVSFTCLGLHDLRESEEAFLSGAMREITPLVRVVVPPASCWQVSGRPEAGGTGGIVIGSGRPGPLTRRLIAAYRERVMRECPAYHF